MCILLEEKEGSNRAMSEATDMDYWFLRNNGIDAKTALRILAIAYSVKEQVVEAADQ